MNTHASVKERRAAEKGEKAHLHSPVGSCARSTLRRRARRGHSFLISGSVITADERADGERLERYRPVKAQIFGGASPTRHARWQLAALDDDIIDQIFTLGQNFETFDSLRGVCKALLAVFSTHPNSITTANLVGPVMPEALRYLRYRRRVEKAPLANNAAVVHRLEAIFSLWYKDRNSTTSVLAPQEAFRFRRAMHRVMIHTKCFSLSPDVQNICDERLAMLSEYPAPDLREIHCAAIFLRQLIYWVLQDDARTDLEVPDQCYDICIAAEPPLVLATRERHDMDLRDELCPMYDS
ncbi:hypothetical protein DFH09DRAFT_1330200 [Mycena vulgaris]|nr:hypothetical protein DFH09DRAFT_1330200 [Mycena vulgaris]